MEIKFFAKDVIGKKPTKSGDTFKAKFMGRTATFQVTEISGPSIFAVLK
jgi:hypothetical protein